MSAINSLNEHDKRNQAVSEFFFQRERGSKNASARHDIKQNSLVEALDIGASPSRNAFIDMSSTNVSFLRRNKTEVQSTSRKALLSKTSASNGGESTHHVFHNFAPAVPNTVGSTYNYKAYSTSLFKKRKIFRTDMDTTEEENF